MDWMLVAIGALTFVVCGWVLHRRYGRSAPQTHSNVKPTQDHDPMEVAKATFIGIPPSR